MTVEIQLGATLEVFGTVIVQPGGDLHVAGGTVSPVAVENRGGTLSGQGAIGGEVLNQGRLEPGGAGQTGVLSFLASFDQLAQGTIAIDIHGTDNSNPARPEYDQVMIAGETLLTGTVEIVTGGAYVHPTTRGASDDFAVVTATRIFGSLDQVLYDGVPLVADFRFEGTESFRDHVADGLFRWIFYTGSELVLSNYLALPGDADGDGEVAFADFVSLSDAFGAAGDWTNGDFDGDGIVRFPDFVLLADHFGESAAAAAAAMAVPEPVGAVLGILGLLACPFVRRRAREPAR
jgi:hypothetical protein